MYIRWFWLPHIYSHEYTICCLLRILIYNLLGYVLVLPFVLYLTGLTLSINTLLQPENSQDAESDHENFCKQNTLSGFFRSYVL